MVVRAVVVHRRLVEASAAEPRHFQYRRPDHSPKVTGGGHLRGQSSLKEDGAALSLGRARSREANTRGIDGSDGTQGPPDGPATHPGAYTDCHSLYVAPPFFGSAKDGKNDR